MDNDRALEWESIEDILAKPLKPNLKELSRKPDNKKPCAKCKGLGKIGIYFNVKNGKCFECNGRGFHHI